MVNGIAHIRSGFKTETFYFSKFYFKYCKYFDWLCSFAHIEFAHLSFAHIEFGHIVVAHIIICADLNLRTWNLRTLIMRILLFAH